PMILSQINQQLTELLGSQSKMTLNELRDFQAEWLGLQLEGQVVRQAVIIQDYRNSLFKSEKFIRNQCLALLIFTQHFPEVPVRVIGVLPQLEPAIVIDLERKVTEIQSYWAHEHIQANLEIVIYQPRTAVASRGQRNRSGAENIRNTTVSLIKKAKINQEICKSLQDIRFCKTMFGVNFPILMSRSNYLRSQYKREIFAEQLVMIQGKEYFVFTQWQSPNLVRFQRWLQSQA
ncbi:MAG: hypothetical protein ACRC17_10485, partial [Culicoidibacterales bacterium]